MSEIQGVYPSADEALKGLTVEKLDDLLAQLDKQADWTQKSEARQTGYSLYIRWADEKKRDVMEAIEHQNILTTSPALLYDALSRLRAIVASDGQ